MNSTMQKLVMQRLALGIAAIALIAGGFISGRYWPTTSNPTSAASAELSGAAKAAERTVLYWYDPMMPDKHFDAPGKSPFMDMQLVAKYAEAAEADSNAGQGVRIDAGMAQNLGVRLSIVKRSPQAQEIRASGVLAFDGRALSIIQSRTAGFVERVWPLAAGDRLKAGQPLVQLLVPEWAAAQTELVAVRALRDPVLLQAARTRLQLLGMSEALISRVASSGRIEPMLTITAAQAGVVLSVDVRSGMSVLAGQTLLTMNGFSDIWLDVAVPQVQAARVQPGTAVSAAIAGLSAPVSGTVLDILPELDAASRSLRVRIVLSNADRQLHPGMRADVALQSTGSTPVLTVPTEAIIRTGQRSVVMVAQKGGRFAPTEVILGAEVGAQTQVISGLQEGQQIVSSGQFLFDSEANLSGLGLSEAAPDAADAPDAAETHEMHDMHEQATPGHTP